MFDTTAIVTGASRGIGRSTAIRLAQDFSALVLAARGKAQLQDVSMECRFSDRGDLVAEATFHAHQIHP